MAFHEISTGKLFPYLHSFSAFSLHMILHFWELLAFFFYVYSCSYTGVLIPHYSNTAFKAPMLMERTKEEGWKKYLWLFIPSSSFSTPAPLTDVGRGIFSPSQFSCFCFSFFFGINIHIPVLFDVTATCCSHFLCSLVFLQLKNFIINKYTKHRLKCRRICFFI